MIFRIFMALRATFMRGKLRLFTTLEAPGAIIIGRIKTAPKNLSASKPQIEISRRWQESVFIYSPYVWLQKQQKVTQQQKNVVAGKNLPYVMLSRIKELKQLYILEELPEDKIYPIQKALEEISVNK